MNILALESSAGAASVALVRDEFLVAQSFQNTGLTHSRTLMPMVEDLLKNTETTLAEIDLIAVAAGPGSFTGLRIGVSAAKGLAWAADKPCCAVSTLEAMAWTAAHMGGQLCPAMDARRGQVYNARFESVDGIPRRLTPDRAISLEELAEEIRGAGSPPQLVLGDGWQLSRDYLSQRDIEVLLPPPHLRWQTAWGVARGALEMARAGKTVTAGELTPQYHRLSQAERERLEKNKEGSDHGR